MGAIDGLISGLNTTQIISQLMQIERLPEQQLTNHKTDSQNMVSSMQSLNSLFTALQTAAKAFVPDSITQQSAWGSTTATSSASALATVTTGPGAQPGSARFVVTSVASAASVVSSGTVGSLTTPVYHTSRSGLTVTYVTAKHVFAQLTAAKRPEIGPPPPANDALARMLSLEPAAIRGGARPGAVSRAWLGRETRIAAADAPASPKEPRFARRRRVIRLSR